MTLLDLILILIIFFFTVSGFWFGLIMTLGSLLGTVAGVLVAGHYFEAFATKLTGLAMGNAGVAKVFAFILIFLLVSRFVGFIFWIVNKIFNIIAIIPFLKSLNRIGGGVLGFIEGVVFLGVALVIAAKYVTVRWYMDAILASSVAQWLMKYGDLLVPLLPKTTLDVKGILEERLRLKGIKLR